MKEKEGEPQEKSPTGADRSGARASSLRRGENLDAARRPTESARLSEGSFPAEAPISGQAYRDGVLVRRGEDTDMHRRVA